MPKTDNGNDTLFRSDNDSLSYSGRASLKRSEPLPDEVIVKFSDRFSKSVYTDLFSDLGLSSKQQTQSFSYHLVDLPANMSLAEAIARLEEHALVEYAGPNHRLYAGIVETRAVVNDPRFDDLWGLDNTGQTGGLADADIDAPEAWEIGTGTEIVVGVIDTGVDYTHPDLAVNMWVNPGEIPDNGIDDDGNGYVDDVHGYDFAYGDADPMDGDGHGTHVAGTIAADGNNGIGVTGVNWSAKIMALKFLDDNGEGTDFAAIQAIEYAVMMGADVTNNSWGGYSFSQGIYDAIVEAGEAGQLFIAAAGNESNNNDLVPSYPASYNLDNVISVAATDHRDDLANFSNIGAQTVDLGAPGVDILSTLPGGGYGVLSGTSMAAPHVAGAAALILGTEPGLSPAEVKERLLTSVDPLPDLTGNTVTGGRLNLAGALSDGPAMPTVSIRPAIADRLEGNAGTTEFTFTVERTGDSADVLTVDYAVSGSGSTPADPGDFAGGAFPSGAVTLESGQSSDTITVEVLADLSDEPDERFTVTLSDPDGDAEIAIGAATGTIRDDDTVGKTFQPAFQGISNTAAAYPFIDESVGTLFRTEDAITVDALGIFDEGGDGLAEGYRVALFDSLGDTLAMADIPNGTSSPLQGGTRWQVLDQPVSLEAGGEYIVATYRSSDADPFGWLTGAEVQAAPGITPLDDLWDFGHGGDGITPVFPGNAEVLDAVVGANFRIAAEPVEPLDPPALSITAVDASRDEGDSGTTPFSFSVSRTGDTSGSTGVDWTVIAGTASADDFGGTLPRGSLTFEAGDSVQSVTVPVAGDSLVEPNEGFTVLLSNPTGEAEITTASAAGTIRNDDAVPQPEPPEAANVFGILYDDMPTLLLSNGTIARVIDAPGAQAIEIRAGASLELQGAAGANTLILPGTADAFSIYHERGAVTLSGPNSETVVVSARAVSQTLVFEDGALKVRIEANQVMAGDQIVSEWPTQLVATLDAAPDLPPPPNTPPATPNYLAAVDATAPDQLIGSGIHAEFVDAEGGQTFHVGAGASLRLDRASGANTLTFQAEAEDVAISRDGSTVTLNGPQNGAVAFDALTTPQSLVFLDGAMDIVLEDDGVFAGGQLVTEAPALLTATPDPDETSDGVFETLADPVDGHLVYTVADVTVLTDFADILVG